MEFTIIGKVYYYLSILWYTHFILVKFITNSCTHPHTHFPTRELICLVILSSFLVSSMCWVLAPLLNTQPLYTAAALYSGKHWVSVKFLSVLLLSSDFPRSSIWGGVVYWIRLGLENQTARVKFQLCHPLAMEPGTSSLDLSKIEITTT